MKHIQKQDFKDVEIIQEPGRQVKKRILRDIGVRSRDINTALRQLIENGKDITYHYNRLNQLVSMVDDQDTHEYVYDGRGNLETVSRNGNVIQEYFFGELNRLEEAFNHEKKLLSTYDYNGLGHRVRQTMLNAESLDKERQRDDLIDLTKPCHNLLQRSEAPFVGGFLEPNDPKSKTSRFVYDFGVLSGTKKTHHGEEVLHYLHDDLGSPIRMMNERGKVQDILDYDEFGNSLRKGYSDQPFGFTGYQSPDEAADCYKLGYIKPREGYSCR